MGKIISFHTPGERYQTLRFIGFLFSLLGTVLLAIGALLLVFGLYTLLAGTTGEPTPGTGPFAARQVSVLSLGAGLVGILFLWSFGFLLSGLQFIVAGALLRLLIHLEENTRASAQALDKIRMRLESRGEDVEPSFRS